MLPKFISSIDPKNQNELELIDKRLSDFYETAFKKSYWIYAQEINENWFDSKHPFHAHLASQIKINDRIADFGCGTAHVLEAVGNSSRYTGIDVGLELKTINENKYPKSSFINASIYSSGLPSASFDISMSLYVLEHCVYPCKLLDEMNRVLKPGGKLCIICPEFRPRLMNSIWAGISPIQSRKEKLKQLKLFDLGWHLLEQHLIIPLYLKKIDKRGEEFLILKDPRCFHTNYTSDTDAVYWSSQKEVENYILKLGYKILFNKDDINSKSTNTIYLVAEKL